jgi:adenine-specific DNA-methyltransferase
VAENWTEYGEVYTRRWVVDSILDLVGYDPAKDLAASVIVEPSIGSGAFIVPIVERLLTSAATHARPPEDLVDAIRGYDLLAASVERSRAALAPVLARHGVSDEAAAGLLRSWLHVSDFLLAEDIPKGVEYVVGNPPYIRLEEIPEDITALYRAAWSTMRGRADIYIGFIERGLGLLREDGALGYICADRWMRNQYGATLRELVARDYAVEAVWSMHQVDAFEVEVDAYPAVTVLRNAPQGQAVVADTTTAFGEASARELTAWTLGTGASAEGDGFEAFRLEGWFGRGEKWVSGRPSLIALMEYLNEHFQPLQDPITGTRVSIGVATGADNVYVVKTAEVEPDRLLPLSMVRDLTSGAFIWGGNYLVNPWDEKGALVDLDDYPLLRAHFLAHPRLVERHTARKQPHGWYRTIDKVNHSILDRPKLLIQDMRASINPVLEPGGKYPHHNLYYVVSETWDMEVLGGLLLSRIGQAFIEAYGVRMRGGTLRFQAQYLKLIRVPRPDSIAPAVAERLRLAFRSRDIEAATLAAGDAYGIDVREYDLLDSEQVSAN